MAAPMDRAQFPYLYRHSGLLIASQLELPEWASFGQVERGEPDVRIVLDPPLAENPTESRHSGTGGALEFTVEEAGTWTVSGGNTIRIAPAPDARAPELRLFTLGSAWGALGYQRGFAMLHGSAVAVDDGAVLFVGYSTQGKSTMAAAMILRGHRLVADDLSRVDPPGEAGGAPQLYPSAARIKLWDTAIDRFGWQDRPREQDHFRTNKFHLPIAGDIPRDPVPLKAIYSLDWRPEISFNRLRGGAALTELLSKSLYRQHFLEAMGNFSDQVLQCVDFTRSVPVWELGRPQDFAQLDAVCDALEQHWASGEAFSP